MNVVLDMNISPEWVPYFVKAGHTCTHWRDIGAATAEDEEIFRWAIENHVVVVTHDLDFGAILAATNSMAPSVIQVRMRHWLPENPDAHKIFQYLTQYATVLDSGALITIDAKRLRVRILPLDNR